MRLARRLISAAIRVDLRCRHRLWALGFGLWGLGFGVWGLGFGVRSDLRRLGFGVWGLGFRRKPSTPKPQNRGLEETGFLLRETEEVPKATATFIKLRIAPGGFMYLIPG